MSQHHRCDVGEDKGRRRPDDQSNWKEAETLLEPPHGPLTKCVCAAGKLWPVHNIKSGSHTTVSSVWSPAEHDTMKKTKYISPLICLVLIPISELIKIN